MTAQSIAINLTGPCNAACPYCITKMTYKTGVQNNLRLLAALPRALDFARMCGATTAIITGSCEPTMCSCFAEVVSTAAQHLPIVELQTNGYILSTYTSQDLAALHNRGLSTVAISVCATEAKKNHEITGVPYFDFCSLAANLERNGFLVRLTMNLLEETCAHLAEETPNSITGLSTKPPLEDWIVFCQNHGIKQLTLHELGKPDYMVDANRAVAAWIEEHKMKHDTLERLKARVVEGSTTKLRQLAYGTSVYAFRAMAVCVNDCMTDTDNPDEVRSLILQPDGHVYHSWQHPASVLM